MRTMKTLTQAQIEKKCGNAAPIARQRAILYARSWHDVDPEEWAELGVPNFKPRECADTRTGQLLVDRFTLHRLQALRTFAGHPMYITSGYRLPSTNKRVGGHPRSAHMCGRAFDFQIGDKRFSKDILIQASRFGFQGIGVRAHGDQPYMHIDDVERATGHAFWTYE